MSRKKNFTKIVLSLFVLVVCFFFTALYLNSKQQKELFSNGLSGIGVLNDVGSKYLRIEYKIDEKHYTDGDSKPYQYLQNEEEYEIKFMKDDPETITIRYSRPIFSSRYQFETATCNSLSKTLSVVTFRYIVNGSGYTRQAYYKEGQSLNASDYLIKYRTDNPQIGYLIKR